MRELTIHESDISSVVCQGCAECCRIKIKIPQTDSRYRQFLRATGFALKPPAKSGEQDCCAESHDVEIDFGYCKHLTVPRAPGERFVCQLHESPELPQLCRDYNCVSWAKANNAYGPGNEILVAAQMAMHATTKGD